MDPDEVLGEVTLSSLSAELTALRDRHQTLLTDQSRRDERVRAAARRAAAADALRYSRIYVNAAIEEALLPLTGLTYRVEQLGERAGTRQVTELRTAARAARAALDLARATRPKEASLVDDLQGEVARLRLYVTVTGRAMHVASGQADVDCECPGCHLIIGMDSTSPEFSPAALATQP